MAFKMKGSPMFRNYGHPFKDTGDHKHPHGATKAEARTIERGEGTEKSETGNLLNVLGNYGEKNEAQDKIQRSGESGGKLSKQRYYDENKGDDHSGESAKAHDQTVIEQGKKNVDSAWRGSGKDEAAAQARSDEANEAARKGKQEGIANAIKTEATSRSKQNKKADETTARVNARNEAIRVAGLSKKQLRAEEKAKANR
jgi:hypothetical protein